MSDPRSAASHSLPRLTVTARFDREAFGGDDAEAFLILTLRAAAAPTASPAPPLALALVLDASGSMAGAKLVAARAAALRVGERLRAADALAVVSFADDVIVHALPQPAAPPLPPALAAELAALGTRGSTDLAAGWLTGAALLEPLAGGARRTHVVLLSDGWANRGLRDPRQLGARSDALRERGITSTCVGIGADYATQQLGPIAERGGGRFHHADDAPTIERLLLGELAELGATAVRDAVLWLGGAPGLEVELVSDLVAEPAAGGLAVRLGDLLDAAERTVVVRVRAASLAARQQPWAIVAELRGRDPRDGAEVASWRESAALPPSPQPRVAPWPAAAAAVAAAWGARLLRRSADANERGELDVVAAMVWAEGAAMRRYADRSPAARAAVEQACLDAAPLAAPASPDLRKQAFVRGWKGSRGERDWRG